MVRVRENDEEICKGNLANGGRKNAGVEGRIGDLF